MYVRPRFALLIPLAAALGCGANPTPGNPSSPVQTYLTGNWIALAPTNVSSPGTLPTPIAEFMGALQSTNGTVSGTFRALDPTILNPCVSITQDLHVAGTLSSTGELVLTIPMSGGTATINAALPQNLNTFFNGTWQIIGGACAMPTTSISMAQIAPVTGTYTGTFSVLDLSTLMPVPGSNTLVSAVLTQSATANADGQFPLSGTITASGACNASVSLTNTVVSGASILYQWPVGSPPPAIIFDGAVLPAADRLIGDFLPENACNQQVYSGTLFRQ